MRVVVAGGTGFIGSTLVERLSRSHSVAVLTRGTGGVKRGEAIRWDDPGCDAAIAAADVVVNLAGESIGDGRWTMSRKEALVSSRLGTTRRIVAALSSGNDRARTLINASAVGFYGSRGDEVLTESSPGGDDFLAGLCHQWEAEAMRAAATSRVVILRFGIVLGPGGALPRMALPFRFFGGGPVGSGRQWMSWVDRSDVLGMIEWALENEAVQGVFNATAPGPVINREFARVLGKVLGRPSFLPAPAVALRLALGEMADGLLLSSQRAVPERAQGAGYVFREPELESALRAALRD